MTPPSHSPALSPQEATERAIRFESSTIRLLWIEGDQLHADSSGEEYAPVIVPAQKVAALCLYGQSFGFSQDDVDILTHPMGFDGRLRAQELASLGQRIASLLPPAAGLLPPAQ